jgi:non-specific serine/threonine protein kinase
MTSIAELIAALQANELKLPALFDALTVRGAIPDAEHQAELALLEGQSAESGLMPEIARALAAKLKAVQAAETKPAEIKPVVDDDATVVQPRSVARPPIETPIDPDITVVQPASRRPAPSPPPSSSMDEATVVKPATHRPASSAGGQTGATTQAHTGTGSSSFNTSSWENVANAEGGDYATVGSVLKGRFVLEREIGRGGMGVVFLALDERKVEARDRDPYVAVKVLNDEFRRHPDSLIALQRESRRSQRLAHDNIVRVYDFDKDRAIVFMTMEYIDGSDLKTLIRERAYNGMPLSEARPLIDGMARALQRAHAAGVVHSDFKPGNVMVTRDGVPKVFDFGIARAGKHLGEATGEETVFDAGTLGALTPAYASLEMIRGNEPTPGDDIYALGCVVFELLTGKHPFDKVSAEVAMKEGRKPPPVKGLTKRQYKTLCDSIAFTSPQRLKSADELVEGLRDVGLRERAGPYMIYGAVAVVVLAGGGWGVSQYLHTHHLANVIDGFNVASPRHFVNEEQAKKALNSLGDDDRKRIILDQGDLIQSFLLSRIDAYWNPEQGRYDYTKALGVLQLRDQLKLYSPELDSKRGAMEQQKNDLLNTLDTQLTQRIDAGAIFESQPDNAVATLTTIRRIDPNSALLQNAELELKYDTAIGQSLNSRQVDEVKTRLALATRLFPDSMRLKLRVGQLAALNQSVAAAQQQAAAAAQSVPDARKTLAALIARPASTPEWQNSVTGALGALHGDTSAESRQLENALGEVVAAQAAQQNDPLQFQPTSALVTLALQYAPQSTTLQAQRTRLDGLLQQQQAQLDRESAAAEVASRIESLKRAAAANDVTKAQESLARIRSLQPDSPFLAKDGPQLVADAYLGQANGAFQRGKYQAAADGLAKGIKVLGNRSDLINTQARYDWVASVMKTRGQPLAGIDYARLQQQLAELRRNDANGLSQLEADMKQRGQLPGSTLGSLLEASKPATSTTTNPSTSASTAATPQANGAVRPSAASASKQAASTATPGQAAANAGTPGAPVNDPCAQPSLVGKGKACFDMLDGRRGPALVVVPGAGGAKPFAMSRTEITVNEFNRFCATTKQCTAKTSDDPDAGTLPVSSISLAQARAYATWLSSSSGGFVYRLPTDAEWMQAAQAGSGWKQSADSNCVPPSAGGGDDGAGAPISAVGREANPWGLVNMTGNVWEWVTSGGGVMVRGGSYASYWSDCTVGNHRDDSGAAQKDVGFRILRELK